MRDLIDRQAAIKAIEDLPNCYNGFSDTYDKSCIIGVLEELPSAQRTGRWIWSEEEWGYRCSACKVKFDYDKTYELFDHGFMLANYCPNCGARMEEQE